MICLHWQSLFCTKITAYSANPYCRIINNKRAVLDYIINNNISVKAQPHQTCPDDHLKKTGRAKIDFFLIFHTKFTLFWLDIREKISPSPNSHKN